MKTSTADAISPASPRETLRYFATLPHAMSRKWWLGILILVSIYLVFYVLESTILGYFVDALSGTPLPVVGEGKPAIIALIGIVATCTILNSVVKALINYVIGLKLRFVSIDLKRACLSSTLQSPIPEIMRLGTGNVISRMTKDIDQPINTFSHIGMRVLVSAFIFPFTAISVIFIDLRYSLVLLAVFLLIFPIARRWIMALPAVTNVMSASEARRNSLVLDTLRGLETIRAFSISRWALTRMNKTSWQALQAGGDRLPHIIRLLFLAQSAFGLWLLGTLGLGIWLVSSGEISAGAASAAVFLVVRAEVQVFNAMFFAGDIQEGLTRLGRAVALAKMTETKQTVVAPDLTKTVDVVIKNLSYSYPDTTSPAIPDLSLTLKAGTTTALVGASGAGKSTLASLVTGLLHPTSGSITVGDVDLQTVSDVWTARNVTLISQEVHVFSGTLRDDLLMANPQATDDELHAALEMVGLAKDSVSFNRSFPLGLDTEVGAGAEPLNPEVQQQIALARVALRQPHVLILDEPTSEAGSEYAELIEAAAQKVTESRTALVVAHRLDQAVVADRIILMDQGVIVEDGTHDELLAQEGRYAQLFARWSGHSHKN
ncbi:ABC-type multidrug transport system, ATPase and permease component [Corynebacterium mustelae]|uniref:ABC-type multidrug transport system, ATPase and permease component n=1 Tax=Corynebacterium mustelae TaxID=571915 RepID=A0A0G3GXQ4_9CORY|nr:ABC transporter ATP-binding protein [Corynebacterium mustelae]AKK05951.1 ABC-type multidrug transport system, ATPase and permease component [Corynebacterium mustelae]